MSAQKRMWPEETEPNVVYMTGSFPQGVYLQARAIEVDGVRFTMERTCTLTREFHGTPCSDWRCSECGKISNSPRPGEHCPRCGAKVTRVEDADGTPLNKHGQRADGQF